MHHASRTGWLYSGILSVSLAFAAFAAPAPARAAPSAIHVSLPPASAGDDGFSVRRFFSGFNRRERVVQLCVGVMCLALFILCKKFSEDSR
jgi:hypothetical protein